MHLHINIHYIQFYVMFQYTVYRTGGAGGGGSDPGHGSGLPIMAIHE